MKITTDENSGAHHGATVKLFPMPRDYETNLGAQNLKERRTTAAATMPVTRNQAASSTNESEEDILQRLLLAVAFLQARSEEQSRLSAEAEQRQMEVEERHRLAEERFKETLKLAEQREEELHHQLAAVRATVKKPAGSPTIRRSAGFLSPTF
ncbi:hypothetical protein CR513_58071, partial [Mucuna pruriens]